MYCYSECLELVQAEIKKFTSELNEPKELYEPIQYILNNGGKRIRPVMALMGCNLFNDEIGKAIPVALAIEVLHNFTLIHDDIMDNAPIRRNNATVHEKWNTNVAILSGDAMQILAYHLICKANPFQLKSLLDIFNKTALEICEGQQYDMNFASSPIVTLSEYLRMIELKTSILIAASLKMGAICGGAEKNDALKLYEFGKNLGLAFQIQDDYLDIYADQNVFGKTTGGDIAENKKTFLIIKALELAKGEHKNILERAVRKQIADNDIKIEMVCDVYTQLNIAEITRTAIEDYSKKAFASLDAVNVQPERKEPLRKLALELMEREK